jgi:hypothetical protein
MTLGRDVCDIKESCIRDTGQQYLLEWLPGQVGTKVTNLIPRNIAIITRRYQLRYQMTLSSGDKTRPERRLNR